MDIEPLNWMAVLVGTVAAFLAGWLLYSPRVLGRAWAAGSGIDIETGGNAPPVLAMILQLAGLFALALVIGLTAQISALGTAILAILAVAGMVVANGAFSGKTSTALAIDAGYALLAGALMIVAQGAL